MSAHCPHGFKHCGYPECVTGWSGASKCTELDDKVWANDPVPSPAKVTGVSSRLDGSSPGEVAPTSPGAARGLHLSSVAGRLSAEEVKMVHDPDDEVTVISENGVGKGVLSGNTIRMVGTVDCTPTPTEIAQVVRYVQAMHKEGNYVGAFNILSAGWPRMQIGQAIKLLNGSITLEEALTTE